MSVGGQRKLHGAADLCAGTGLKLLGLAGTLLLSGCGDDRFPDYRYKMTVVVATPEGERGFSSVREVVQRETSSIQDSSGRMVKTRLKGQAVILDLPDGQTVYALLSKPDHLDYSKYVAGAALLPTVRKPAGGALDDLESSPTSHLDRQAADQQAMVKTVGPRELPRQQTVNSLGVPLAQPLPLWPMFVTFGDPGDPTTVRELSPDSIGVRRITIEMSDEPVTTGIEQRLPWLDTHRGALVRTERGRSMYDKPVAHRVTEGAFRMGSEE